MEEPIRWPCASRELFGVLHMPEAGRARAAILLVNSSVEFRLGPHRLFVRAARHWAARGFAVLRLDYPGNGDSPGDEAYPHMDAFPVEPALDAATLLRERTGTPHVVLAGLCMGARNALYAAGREAGVRHLLAFGMPFSDATPDSAVASGAETRTVGTAVARSAVTGYLKRALDPAAWLRLATGQSDYRVIRRVLPAAFGIGRGRIFREPVFLSLEALLGRQGRILFVFGTNDVFLPDFRDQFELVKPRLPGAASGCDIEFVADANHTFSRVRWQDDAVAAATGWLSRQFPGPEAAGG